MRISYWSSDVCSSDLLADPGDPSCLYPFVLNKKKFNNFSFRVGAEYHFDRDIMAYASYATAFKAGGWTTRLTGPLFDTTTLQPLPAPTFGPEKAKTAEIGVKATLFDRRLRLNIAGFHTDDRKSTRLTSSSY